MANHYPCYSQKICSSSQRAMMDFCSQTKGDKVGKLDIRRASNVPWQKQQYSQKHASKRLKATNKRKLGGRISSITDYQKAFPMDIGLLHTYSVPSCPQKRWLGRLKRIFLEDKWGATEQLLVRPCPMNLESQWKSSHVFYDLFNGIVLSSSSHLSHNPGHSRERVLSMGLEQCSALLDCHYPRYILHNTPIISPAYAYTWFQTYPVSPQSHKALHSVTPVATFLSWQKAAQKMLYCTVLYSTMCKYRLIVL